MEDRDRKDSKGDAGSDDPLIQGEEGSGVGAGAGLSEPPERPQARKPPQFLVNRSFLSRCVITSSFGSLLLGYDLGIISGAVIPLEKRFGLNHHEVSILVSCITFAACLGALIAGQVADAFGRRVALLLASVVFCIGSLAMALAGSFAELIAWRCVTGIGVGVALVTCPMYCAELSPRQYRGGLTSMNEVFINVGIPLAYAVGLMVRGAPHDWRIMFMIGAGLAFCLFAMTLFLPESPNWLLKHGYRERARTIVRSIVSQREDATVRDRVARQMLEELRADMATADREAQLTWGRVFARENRRTLIIGLVFAAMQQLIGTDSVVFFSVYTLERYAAVPERTALAVALVMGILKLVATVGTARIVDRADVGRRRPLIVSGVGCLASMLLIGIAGFFAGSTAAAVVIIIGLLGFMAFFAVGYGPLTWLLLAEMFRGPHRSKALSLGSTINRLCSALVTYTYLYIVSALTFPGTYLFYAAVCAVHAVFSYLCIPDLTGQPMGAKQDASARSRDNCASILLT